MELGLVLQCLMLIRLKTLTIDFVPFLSKFSLTIHNRSGLLLKTLQELRIGLNTLFKVLFAGCILHRDAPACFMLLHTVLAEEASPVKDAGILLQSKVLVQAFILEGLLE